MSEKTLYATRTFNDAGTRRSFEGGKPIENVTAGELQNYFAAGLVTDTPAAGTDDSRTAYSDSGDLPG